VFWVISVYFNIRNTLPKFCPFLLGHPVYITLQCTNLTVPSLQNWHCKNKLIYASYHELPEDGCLQPKYVAGMLYIMCNPPPQVKVYLCVFKNVVLNSLEL